MLNGTKEGGGEGPQKLQKSTPQNKNIKYQTNYAYTNNEFISSSYVNDQHIGSEIMVALPKEEFSGNMKDLDDKIETMMS